MGNTLSLYARCPPVVKTLLGNPGIFPHLPEIRGHPVWDGVDEEQNLDIISAKSEKETFAKK